MIDRSASGRKALVVGLQTRVCALPLKHVIETMRPLPVEQIAGLPLFVRGVSIIRGIPTPVVDLGVVLGTPSGDADRFVTLRLGDRQVALAVDAVLGVHELEPIVQELPPLLQGASKDIIEAISTLDKQVLMVLREGWELPDQVWQAMTAQEAVS
jgi:purine-binding chemotaxis protein CheW